MNVKRQQNSHPSSPVGETSTTKTTTSSELGYQLRALKENISALETNPWIQASTLTEKLKLSSLSNELVNETLSYFVNCGQRLSQMTKAYDDNEAYILLLQEKEIDLELAARIGQDLLNQNKQLKDSIKSLEDELAQRRDDVQQLRHELASKNSLLDTFIEEEEQQTSLTESEEDLTLKVQQDHPLVTKSCTPTNNNHTKISSSLSLRSPEVNGQQDATTGFLSLNFNNQRPASTTIEPFSSLPHQQMGNSFSCDSRQHSANDDSASSIGESNLKSCNESVDQQNLVQTVTLQLLESNKRLCELQDEIFYKSEQNLMQQEKIYHLQDRLRELDQRLGYIAAENETLHKSVSEADEIRRELSDELKVCKRNFSELLRVFLEMQKESRFYRISGMQQNSNFFGELDPVNDINNISFDSYSDNQLEINNTTTSEVFNQNAVRPLASSSKMPTSSSLLEELQESMKKNGDYRSDGYSTDGGDSGVHTNNISSHPVTPTADSHSESNCGNNSQNDTRNKKSWLGFSSFMITTLLLICLSVTLSSSANFNLAQKLQFKLER